MLQEIQEIREDLANAEFELMVSSSEETKSILREWVDELLEEEAVMIEGEILFYTIGQLK